MPHKFTNQYDFSFQSLILSKSFEVEGGFKYTLENRPWSENTYRLYCLHDDGNKELLGFAGLVKKYEIKVHKRTGGMDFEATIKFKDIKNIIPDE